VIINTVRRLTIQLPATSSANPLNLPIQLRAVSLAAVRQLQAPSQQQADLCLVAELLNQQQAGHSSAAELHQLHHPADSLSAVVPHQPLHPYSADRNLHQQ
jgi:hypothetical protein